MDSKTRTCSQQAISSVEAPQKQQRKRNVVVHNTMAATPTEDWVLYPDNVVTVKNSTVREQRTVKSRTQPRTKTTLGNGMAVRPMMLPTPPGSSPAQSGRERVVERRDATKFHDVPDLHDRPTSGSTSVPAVVSQKTRTEPYYPHRLPTPDLSDVDEDEFWACCDYGNRRH
ncbi:MAG: hypothetical protein Q9208_006239 [Pyrenodesmia sp. 3 TL-2023]